ncbi:MAG: PD-(D/E)XK nuclease family protein [Nitrospirae bacterium]|nr:PD-(D/E)XK nuclease family protein [Nitrospirota bacterium]
MAHSEKEKEEQKRLFYVASTRAENRLILTGCYDDKENQSFLTFLKQGLGLTKNEEGYRMEAEVNGLSVLTEQDIDALYRKISAEGKRAEKERQLPGIPSELPNFPAVVSKEPQWRAVTEAVKIRRQHGKEWLFIGDVMHKVFEEISKGTLKEGDITERGNKLLALKGIVKTEREGLLKIIENDIAILKGKDIYQDIILPQENAYAELPFILEVEQKTLTPESQSPIPVVYSGRIDRVIVKDGWYHIYDYKTFPAEEKDLEYLLKEYSFQLSIYRKAVKELFNTKNVKSFILFTHTGEVREA